MGSTIETIAEEIEDRAASLGGIERSDDGQCVAYARSGREFAVVDRDGLEFRVGPTIGTAALRTPDAGPSSRGGEWVRLEPGELERTAVDRAVSWFEAAWRRAEPS